MTKYPMPGEKWHHYKGGIYEILTLCKHSETDEILVIYKSIPFGSIHARPFEMWHELVESDNNRKVPRFQLIERGTDTWP